MTARGKLPASGVPNAYGLRPGTSKRCYVPSMRFDLIVATRLGVWLVHSSLHFGPMLLSMPLNRGHLASVPPSLVGLEFPSLLR